MDARVKSSSFGSTRTSSHFHALAISCYSSLLSAISLFNVFLFLSPSSSPRYGAAPVASHSQFISSSNFYYDHDDNEDAETHRRQDAQPRRGYTSSSSSSRQRLQQQQQQQQYQALQPQQQYHQTQRNSPRNPLTVHDDATRAKRDVGATTGGVRRSGSGVGRSGSGVERSDSQVGRSDSRVGRSDGGSGGEGSRRGGESGGQVSMRKTRHSSGSRGAKDGRKHDSGISIDDHLAVVAGRICGGCISSTSDEGFEDEEEAESPAPIRSPKFI